MDYTVFNWYTFTHRRSPFTQRLVVQKVSDTLRRSLLGDELTLIHPGWVRQARTVSPTELPAILAADFSIELTARDAQALRHLRAHQSSRDTSEGK